MMLPLQDHPSPAFPARCRQWAALGCSRGGLLVALALGLACGAVYAEDPARIAGLGDAPTVIAGQRGLFEAAGEDVEIRHARDGGTQLARLRSGEAAYAVVPLVRVALHLRADDSPRDGDDPVVLASFGRQLRHSAVLARADRTGGRPVDLAGGRIGVPPSPEAQFAWWYFATYRGLDTDTIRVVDRSPEELVTGLAEGSLDAAVLGQPDRARARERAGTSLHLVPEGGLAVTEYVLATTYREARQRSRRAERVLEGYRRGRDYADRHPDAARELYAAHAGAAISDVGTIGYHLHLDWDVLAALQQRLEWLAARGDPARSPPEVLAVLEPGPLRAVLPGAVGIPSESPPAREREGNP